MNTNVLERGLPTVDRWCAIGCCSNKCISSNGLPETGSDIEQGSATLLAVTLLRLLSVIRPERGWGEGSSLLAG